MPQARILNTSKAFRRFLLIMNLLPKGKKKCLTKHSKDLMVFYNYLLVKNTIPKCFGIHSFQSMCKFSLLQGMQNTDSSWQSFVTGKNTQPLTNPSAMRNGSFGTVFNNILLAAIRQSLLMSLNDSYNRGLTFDPHRLEAGKVLFVGITCCRLITAY